MTNTLNTPIEVVESKFPVRITRYAIRRHSGGGGRRPGGDGLVREFEFRVHAKEVLHLKGVLLCKDRAGCVAKAATWPDETRRAVQDLSLAAATKARRPTS